MTIGTGLRQGHQNIRTGLLENLITGGAMRTVFRWAIHFFRTMNGMIKSAVFKWALFVRRTIISKGTVLLKGTLLFKVAQQVDKDSKGSYTLCMHLLVATLKMSNGKSCLLPRLPSEMGWPEVWGLNVCDKEGQECYNFNKITGKWDNGTTGINTFQNLNCGYKIHHFSRVNLF